MKTKVLLFVIFSISTLLLSAQDSTSNKTWDLLLNNVKIRYFYSLKYDAVLPKPKFGKKLKKLDGQTITIRGFFLPIDITGNIFVLSYNPMNMCFFCTGNGLQTIIELNVSAEHLQRFKRLKTDNYFEVSGKLKLNTNSYEHLIYILNDAKFEKLIK